MFNQTVLEHFRNPRNAGEAKNASATVEVVNPVCGDVLRLSVRMEAGRVAEARFKTQGCVAAIAASSVLTDLMVGKSVGEVRLITPQLLFMRLISARTRWTLLRPNWFEARAA
jgi:nitrogen fixation NifU-like protein